jgi:predicted 3-demethylubiquinone-9 3-methyltransferase (glyoxalase superfamily)
LWFNGQAKAAADLYCSIFPDSKIKSESPVVVDFELCGQRFIGLNGGDMYRPNAAISFYVACETEAEVRSLWEILSENGKDMMPLGKYPWSDLYGWMQDCFGVTWQITVDKTRAAGQRITPSMLFTLESHGKGNEAIDFYTSVFPNSTLVMKAFYDEGESNYASTGMLKFSQFNLLGQSFTIMDSGFPMPYTFNEGISFVVDCDNQAEVDYFWGKLTEGGQESQCAWLKDKFGVSWQIVPKLLTQLLNHPDREKAGRAMQAMFKMRKIDTVALQKAFDGQ